MSNTVGRLDVKSYMPPISIVTPTFNSAATLDRCLESIANQDYPKGQIEIIIADGGSDDDTIEIARRYTDKILPNPLKTGEAGKAVAIKEVRNEIVALIDSDNILPTRDWLREMVKPLEDGEIAGSEPLYYTYRKEDGNITRYCALLGTNDPLCFFLGNYDRYCQLTSKWTESPVKEEDKGDYLKITLDKTYLPTIGANGFLVRKELLTSCSISDYLFDIDLVYELVEQGYNKFAKVKIGIVHLFSGSISTFSRKQRRRIRDYTYYQRLGLRKYPWSSLSKVKLLKFVVYTLLIIPILLQAVRGYLIKRDKAWFFHMPACWVTLLVYSYGTLRSLFRVTPENRTTWKGQK